MSDKAKDGPVCRVRVEQGVLGSNAAVRYSVSIPNGADVPPLVAHLQSVLNQDEYRRTQGGIGILKITGLRDETVAVVGFMMALMLTRHTHIAIEAASKIVEVQDRAFPYNPKSPVFHPKKNFVVPT